MSGTEFRLLKLNDLIRAEISDQSRTIFYQINCGVRAYVAFD